jgi:hypothetical protein
MRLNRSSRFVASIVGSLAGACGLAASAQAQCTATTLNHLWGEAQVVKVRNGVAYFGYPGHIQIVNVLNPAIPIELGRVAFSGSSEELHLNGNYLYVAAGGGGLVIIDISNSSSPAVVGVLDVGEATDVAVSNATAFVVADLDAKIVDVTNPAAPVLSSTYEHSSAWVDSIASSGSTFYVSNTGGTIDAVDATNRGTPVLLDTIDASASIAHAMALRGNTLAVFGYDDTTLVDITNPAALAINAVLPNDGIDSVGAIGVDGGVTLLHYQYETDSIRTYDITNPAAPLLRSTVPGWFYMNQLTTSDGDLYELGAGDARVHDFANPVSPVVVADIPQAPIYPNPLVISGSTALFGSDENLYSMSVALPTSPTVPIVAHVSQGDEIECLVIEGDRLYMAVNEFSADSVVEILDIATPAAPTLLGSRAIPDGPEAMDVLDDRVFVLDELSVLRILDATAANSVVAEGMLDLSAQIVSSFDATVHARGGFVFVSHDDGLVVVEVSRPWAPALATELFARPGEYVAGFAMRDDLAFIGQSDDLIEVFDLSNPLSPVLLDSITSPNGIHEIGMIDSLLFVYDFDDNLSIVDTADPADIALVTTMAQGAVPVHFARRANTLWTSGYQGISAVLLPDFPRITAWPQDQALCASTTTATFSVTVGNNAGAIYQWQRNGLNVVNGAAPGGATIAGATTNTLTITNPSINQLGQYVCVVSKGCGTTTTEPASLALAVPPVITQQPQSQTICVREGVTFEVAGIVTPPVAYQWQREAPAGSGVWQNVVDGLSSRTEVAGSQERVLTISARAGQSIPSGFGSNYRVIVTNACGSATSNPALLSLAGTCCDSVDFNNDGSFFDPTDIDAFLSVFSEGPCIPGAATCNDVDFNNDTSVFDPCDVDAFLLVFSEGPCTGCGQ